ncbi:hypothetical protein RRG08_034131 [Elysia crispata]|uniref:Uncharacterized protein n=1 Tax=Elysia crispata TaxID=231223 RepID=A0AAE0ZKY8_9GAST|nr:hypothetical protein RRG08_034131 [Elysia crispata]
MMKSNRNNLQFMDNSKRIVNSQGTPSAVSLCATSCRPKNTTTALGKKLSVCCSHLCSRPFSTELPWETRY